MTASQTLKTQLLVIGGGPGGHVAAIRAGQLGVETVEDAPPRLDFAETVHESALKALGPAIHI